MHKEKNCTSTPHQFCSLAHNSVENELEILDLRHKSNVIQFRRLYGKRKAVFTAGDFDKPFVFHENNDIPPFRFNFL